MPRSDITRRDWLLVILPAGLFLAGLEWIEPRFFLQDDNALYYLPAYVHDVRAVSSDREFAFLNLFQSRGIPHLGVGQTGVLYPPVYVAVVLARAFGDVRWTIDCLVACHLLAAVCGMYVFLRRLGLTLGAWGGALFLATAPFLVVGCRAWVVLAYAAAYTIWGLVLLVSFLRQPNWRTAVTLAALQTVYFFCGYPQLFLFSALFLGIFWGTALAIVRTRNPANGIAVSIGRLVAAAGLTTLWVMPLLLPMLAVQSESVGRQSSMPREIFVEHSLEPGVFLRAQIFAFESQYIHAASSSLFYVGIPVLIGLLAALFPFEQTENQQRFPISNAGLVRFSAAVAAIAIVASTKLWGLAYGLPLISLFRWPFKSFLFFLLFTVPPAAWSLERLARRHRLAAILVLATVLGGNLAVVGQAPARASFGFLTVPEPVQQYQQRSPLPVTEPPRRTASFRPEERPVAPEVVPHLRFFNLATLLGEDPHFGGYEPLISASAFGNALGTRAGLITATPALTSPDALRHLGNWGVGTLLTPRDPHLYRALLESGLAEPAETTRWVQVFELTSHRPIVEDLRTGHALPFQMNTNGIELEVESPGTAIRAAVEPLAGWTWSLDGDRQGPPQEHPDGGWALPVPPGRHHIELDYEAPGFRAGLAGALLGTIALLVAILRFRRQERTG
ncbi:MAG: hypothetical protein MPN21_02595 [Thermoanaerobaculia bacterium]|nr:hypothetical protein [Thermoanaerobaculia bacterium]